jgi:hypothetical protein
LTDCTRLVDFAAGEDFNMSKFDNLISIMQDARKLLAIPGNDFCYSSWKGEKEALEEVDGIINRLHQELLSDKLTLKVLFAPTGPIQEVSMSNGWSETYLKLAENFDNEIAKF